MSTWLHPAGTSGDIKLVRTNLGAARLDPRDCSAKRSSDARPMLIADPEPPELAEKFQDFTLKVFMDALDLIEHGPKDPEQVIGELWRTKGTFGLYRRPVAHPLLLSWSAAAVRRYLAARAADQHARLAAGLPLTVPVRDNWVVGKGPGPVDARGVDTYEMTAWGRRYAARDGSTRDLWLLTFGAAKDNRPEGEKAVAAYVAARGRPAVDGWRKRHTPVPLDRFDEPERYRTVQPAQVRVFEFGCGDGKHKELLDWNGQQARQHFTGEGWPALLHAIDGTGTRPGSGCVDCKAMAGCNALPHAPELLRITPPEPRRPRRSVSISDLRAHRDCPAKYHATRQLKLRSSQPESPEVRRGRVVDDVLNQRHGSTPYQSCKALLGPADPASWGAGRLHLTGKEALDGAAMLEQHAFYCPLDGLAAEEEVRVQYQAVCYDSELDLVLIATPDLLHTRRGGWIWRETKTASRYLYEGEALLKRYPQLALGVLMLAAGVLGGDVARSRVELELLHTDDVTFEELDPSHPRTVDEAREVIAQLAQPWAQDQDYPATPGRHCGGCEALEWCHPGLEHLATTEQEPR
ncbi:PD-(D/E)XK nuclease family protein [Streptomyces sp. ISL-100]|uniref:PD-(D/E)XK nuclease family protein n=1 Tax=Streptomyces sp. ISL-100 TaxID=2819173 RepID=UPI001BE98A51|nr:PD-(D/E)XK nuclease family protein [Streptomyces sp. ISL-100]MBT2400396.1 PD-(D/E)XK nuclease family protein [Streptomyces sp. ISL-100]